MSTITKRPTAPASTFGIHGGAVIARGTPVVVTFPFAIDPNAVGGVTLIGVRAEVVLADDRLSATLATDDLAVGTYTLRAAGIHGSAGEIATDADVVFSVVGTTAPLPSGVTAHHALRVRVGDLHVSRARMDGDPHGHLDVFKSDDPRTGAPVVLAFDERGDAVDYERTLAELAQRRAKAFGTLHESLHDRLAKTTGGSVEIAIWLRAPQPAVEKAEKGATRRPSEAELAVRASWKELLAAFVSRTAKELSLKVEAVDDAAPVLYASARPDDVRRLAQHPDVAAVFLHERGGVLDLSNSIAIANSDDAHTAGFTGKGINVAVYEDGPDSTANLSITAQFKTNPNTSQHARHTHGIIKNVQRGAPHGHAPDCNLHSANTMGLDAIRWAAQDRGCTVISQSFHRDSEQTSGSLSFDDVYKDNLALHWPYPTICEAAGNGPTSEFVNHKGFNRLTVGNHDDNATAMASDSVFRNPTSGHADRELPELAANGMGVTAVGLTLSGTSMAAPAVAGAVACIQQANSVLQSWPEGCRAIVLAAARRNVTGRTWRADLLAGVDGSDGAGALDTKAGVDIARSRKGRNNTASSRGFDVGTIRSADVGSDGFMTYVYRVSVPRLLLRPHVKVALAWDAKIGSLFGIPLSSTLAVDLDLHVRHVNGTGVASSASFDNSYEIAEFDAVAGESYEIRIRRWSGSDDVWYGIAWSVSGQPFFTEFTEPVTGTLHN